MTAPLLAAFATVLIGTACVKVVAGSPDALSRGFDSMFVGFLFLWGLKQRDERFVKFVAI